MSDPQNLGLDELGQRVQAMATPAPEPRLRSQWEQYQGAPLPVGPASSSRPQPAYEAYEDLRVAPPPTPPTPNAVPHSPAAEPNHFSSHIPPQAPPPAPPPPPASQAQPASAAPPAAAPPEDPNAPKSGLQKIIQSVRTALPYVQKLLPLLEGNFANAVSTLMVPVNQQPQHPVPPPQVHVNLETVERGLADLQTAQRELKTQVQEQTGSLKRVEDHLERVREATDRNTLEQQELVEDLRAVGNRISNLAVIGLILLLILLGLNAYFLWRLQHLLR